MAAPGAWTLVNGAREDILNGTFVVGSGYKVALVTSSSNISASSSTFAGVTNEVANGNGYTTGGVSVTLSQTGTTSVNVFFSSNPSWTASGGSITARWAVLYKTGSDVLAFSLLDSAPADVVVAAGNTLQIKSDNTASNPVFTMA
jgi:hypothetical protein